MNNELRLKNLLICLNRAHGSLRKELYRRYLRTPHWRKKRYEAMKRDGFKCCKCWSREKITVHHLTYANLGNEQPADLKTLCDPCHSQMHGRSPIHEENLDILQLRNQGVERKPIVVGHGHRTDRVSAEQPHVEGKTAHFAVAVHEVGDGLNVASSGGSGRVLGIRPIATLAGSDPISAASRPIPHRIPHKTQAIKRRKSRRRYFMAQARVRMK